jgi:hypothetical protein
MNERRGQIVHAPEALRPNDQVIPEMMQADDFGILPCPDEKLCPAQVTVGPFPRDKGRGVQRLMGVANEVKDPAKGNGSVGAIRFVPQPFVLLFEGAQEVHFRRRQGTKRIGFASGLKGRLM